MYIHLIFKRSAKVRKKWQKHKKRTFSVILFCKSKNYRTFAADFGLRVCETVF